MIQIVIRNKIYLQNSESNFNLSLSSWYCNLLLLLCVSNKIELYDIIMNNNNFVVFFFWEKTLLRVNNYI